MDKLYTPNPDGYCGDEDNGQTSAWYVFSALGFYPVCPGSNQYVLGTPLFKHVRINLENGNAIEILADNNSRANRYINSMSVNGKPYDANFLTHDQLIGGAKITYEMAPHSQPPPRHLPRIRPLLLQRRNPLTSPQKHIPLSPDIQAQTSSTLNKPARTNWPRRFCWL